MMCKWGSVWNNGIRKLVLIIKYIFLLCNEVYEKKKNLKIKIVYILCKKGF